jgi:hypothetical protein
MIKDTNLIFSASSGDSPTNTGDNISTNSYDTSPLGLQSPAAGGSTPGYNAGVNVNAGRDLGIGGEMWFEVLVTAAVTSAGAATVKFDLVTDSVAALTNVVDSTGVGVLVSSAVFPKATLIAGFTSRVQLPASASYLKFIGADYVIATANLTAGTFEAKLVVNIQQSDQYESGYAVQ